MCIPSIFNRKKIYPITHPSTPIITKESGYLNIKDKDEYELISYKQTDAPSCELIISEKITRI